MPLLADASYERFSSSVKHIACDRTDAEAMKAALGGKGFEGASRLLHRARAGGWMSHRSV